MWHMWHNRESQRGLTWPNQSWDDRIIKWLPRAGWDTYTYWVLPNLFLHTSWVLRFSIWQGRVSEIIIRHEFHLDFGDDDLTRVRGRGRHAVKVRWQYAWIGDTGWVQVLACIEAGPNAGKRCTGNTHTQRSPAGLSQTCLQEGGSHQCRKNTESPQLKTTSFTCKVQVQQWPLPELNPST